MLRAISAEDGWPIFKPSSSTRFFELVEETPVEFVTRNDGKVTHMMIDGRIKAPRVGGQ